MTKKGLCSKIGSWAAILKIKFSSHCIQSFPRIKLWSIQFIFICCAKQFLVQWLPTRGRFHKLFRALRRTFTPVKSFSKVGRRCRAQMDRAISLIRALRPTFMKSTPGSRHQFRYILGQISSLGHLYVKNYNLLVLLLHVNNSHYQFAPKPTMCGA